MGQSGVEVCGGGGSVERWGGACRQTQRGMPLYNARCNVIHLM